MPDHKSLVMKQQNKAGIVQKTSPPQSLTQILKVVSSKIELLESQILRDVRTDIPLLNNVAEHILSSGGKRLRPALVLLGAEMVGGIDERVMQAAQVIEYLHTPQHCCTMTLLMGRKLEGPGRRLAEYGEMK